ncbi:hypothetical protein [Pedobacter sp. JY14-1]|uniref:hypothetical protein n=1 Tax=Pedobacter sp. JY14-1 TaxID=3034151 RepID=UPI0023E093F1|nr:hypothetical protein [Pedobacter sp. JY14-1]
MMRLLYLFLLVFVPKILDAQANRSTLTQDADRYADATLTGDFKTIMRYTYSGLFKINGGKARLKRDHESSRTRMIAVGESRSKAVVNSVSEIFESGNRHFAVVHINYLTSNPGGIFTLSVPILAVYEDKARSWKFLEAKKLSNANVIALFPGLDSKTTPKFSTVEYLPNQKFSKEMVAYNRSLAHELELYDLDFQAPKGYQRLDTQIVIIDHLGHQHGRSKLSLKSKTGIMVYFTFNRVDTAMQTKLRGFPGPDGQPFDINKNWIPSSGTKYTLFSKSYTQKEFNADISGTYDFEPYKNVHRLSKDEKVRVLMIHKDNWLDIQILYYYTPETEPYLEQVMNETRGMLKFRY